jgi:UDP-glucose 4-epimerase
VVGVDDFSNSSPRVVDRLRELAPRPVVFEQASVCDAGGAGSRLPAPPHRRRGALRGLQGGGRIDAEALAYYANNLGGLLTTCRTMQARGVRRFVFSSSATVYGDPQRLPITEDAPLSATNPYGQTKLIGETILRDLGAPMPSGRPPACATSTPWARIPRPHRRRPARHAQQPDALRGPGGRGAARRAAVYGNDYPTPDGTGVRDYIHVEDLAEGHVAALRRCWTRRAR